MSSTRITTRRGQQIVLAPLPMQKLGSNGTQLDAQPHEVLGTSKAQMPFQASEAISEVSALP